MARSLVSGSPKTGERVVELIGVRKRWPRRGWLVDRKTPGPDILFGLDLEVKRGEIVVVLGENGAGKTTLLKIVAGLAQPDSGFVRLLGSDSAASGPALRRRVAYAGGERGFYFRLSVRENLAFFGALEGLSPRERAGRIAAVIRTVDMEPQLDTRFADLSSGFRQRLSIARALIADPEVLLLDEPTRALDPPHATHLRRFVRETLAERCAKTIIVATNLIDEAIELGDRIAVLRDKKLSFVDLAQGRFDESGIRALFGMTDRA